MHRGRSKPHHASTNPLRQDLVERVRKRASARQDADQDERRKDRSTECSFDSTTNHMTEGHDKSPFEVGHGFGTGMAPIQTLTTRGLKDWTSQRINANEAEAKNEG